MPTESDYIEADMLAEMPFNAADPEAINRARKKAARYAKQRLTLIEALMSQKEGRLYLWDFLESLHVFGNPVVKDDTHATYFNLGMQNAGKIVLQDAMQFSENYALMVKEAKARK